MDLICYLHDGWAPLIRPAPATRPWMDNTPEAFAYRCLPLNIANVHGWEVLNPAGFEAVWDGGSDVQSVTIRPDAGAAPGRTTVSLFGQGILTFHLEGIIRTPPGWNLWVGGSPNRFKDAIAPLTGVIETDWSPFTFTMNWRFTRPNTPVRFEAMEAFCFLFPLRRGAVDAFTPRFAPLADAPDLASRFAAWSEARNAFHERVRNSPPTAPADRWQKHYYRGVDAGGESLISDHQSKLRLRPFNTAAGLQIPAPPLDDAGLAAPPPTLSENTASLRRTVAKREWLLEALERQRALSPKAVGLERRSKISARQFLDSFYAPARPVILTAEMSDWPAVKLWTPKYLKAKIGNTVIAYQGDRCDERHFERRKTEHRRTAPFEVFMDRISDLPGQGYERAGRIVHSRCVLHPYPCQRAERLTFAQSAKRTRLSLCQHRRAVAVGLLSRPTPRVLGIRATKLRGDQLRRPVRGFQRHAKRPAMVRPDQPPEPADRPVGIHPSDRLHLHI